MNDQVSIAFELIEDEINSVLVDYRTQGINALKEGKYSFTEEAISECKELEEFLSKIAFLKVEWDAKFESYAKPLIKAKKQLRSHKKGKKTRLQVIFESQNLMIDKPTAKDTFIETIKHIGIEHIASLDIEFDGKKKLISKTSYHNGSNEVLVCDYYIQTHSDTKEKKRVLDRIAKELDVSLKIDII